MKKIITYCFAAGLVALLGCRDESLNPVPVWESAVHGFGVFADVTEPAANSSARPHIANFARNFPLTSQTATAANVNFKLRWVSLDNKLTVNKMEVYLDMVEAYTDPDGNPKTISLGNGGRLLKTLTAAGNREWTTFSVTPQEVFNMYKDAVVKYDRVKDVKVFENPATPRPTGAWFKSTDRLVLTWRLTTTDGLVYKTWSPDGICADPTPYSQAAANCTLVFGAR